MLPKGANVTVPRSMVDHVATEWGIVRLRGLTIGQRARALIAIAHPKNREALEKEAKDAGLLPYTRATDSKLPRGVIVRKE